MIFNFEEISIEQKVLDLLKVNPKITRIEIAESLGTSDSTIKRALKNMTDSKLIERIGSLRAGEWKVL